MKKYTKEELEKILELHKKWLRYEADGIEADFSNTDLRDASLRGANLRDADLSDADLRDAYLRGVDLRGANLRDADLSDADLSGADLSDADLSGADLSGANLSGANLCGANLCKIYIQIGGIGSERRQSVYCPKDDFMICGCFKGTLKEFENKVKETYPDENNIYRKQYLGFVKYVKEVYHG